MPKVTFQPSGLSLDIDETTTLREAAHALGVDVGDRCGGMGACCNCVVSIVCGAEHVTPKTHLEEPVFYLEPEDRLSCQCKITGDVTILPWLAREATGGAPSQTDLAVGAKTPLG